MRTIKFRAFDDGKMIYPTGALQVLGRFFRVIREDAKLMQFTGLHDKNGTEIFEGDIVQTPCGHSAVEFSHGVFGLNHDFMHPERKTMLGAWGQEHNLRSLDDGYNREIVVTGNVYDTPTPTP
jgi:uncharacterized phage protein (TIGR01671 family)